MAKIYCGPYGTGTGSTRDGYYSGPASGHCAAPGGASFMMLMLYRYRVPVPVLMIH